MLRASTSPRPPVGKGAPLLSDREQQVLALLAKSLSNRAIAKELSIAEGTVKRHTSNIYAKLEARSRIHAVQRAQLLGVVGDD